MSQLGNQFRIARHIKKVTDRNQSKYKIQFIMFSSMFFNEDGDLAHEFYEEVKSKKKKRSKMKKVDSSLLRPQVTLRQKIFENEKAVEDTTVTTNYSYCSFCLPWQISYFQKCLVDQLS